MSTLEALNAISEAIQAHAKLPEVERTLKQVEELAEFRQLELDEANTTIERLKARISELETKLKSTESTLIEANNRIIELNDRNNNLDTSLNELAVAHSNTLHDLSNKEQVIDILSADKAALLMKLEDSKGVVAKLTDTLKSIGASIVAAVEPPVPEVTNPTTFPNPVGLSDTAELVLANPDNAEPMQPMAEPSNADLVKPVTELEHTAEPADGCFPYRYW